MDLNQFKVEKLSEHLYRIVDALDVACYLVVGDQEACLLDTGTGVGNVRACVEGITDLPLTVVLSHAHMDHCGGAGWFEADFQYVTEITEQTGRRRRQCRCPAAGSPANETASW